MINILSKMKYILEYIKYKSEDKPDIKDTIKHPDKKRVFNSLFLSVYIYHPL